MMTVPAKQPIHVDFLPAADLPLPGRLGLTVAPGTWQAYRTLDFRSTAPLIQRDLATLATVHHAHAIVTLQERGEMNRFGLAGLRDAVTAIESEVGGLPDGYGSEIGFAAQGWMRSAADWLARGALLAIDYGFPRREYYHPQRLMGTLMCHYRHRAHADPLWLPGLNDITAHVDFTAMADAAHAAGLDVLGYTTQAHFLLNCGLLEQLGAGHSLQRANQAQRLLSEAEMGELFKVLAVGRGIAEPLLGFARGDRTARL